MIVVLIRVTCRQIIARIAAKGMFTSNFSSIFVKEVPTHGPTLALDLMVDTLYMGYGHPTIRSPSVGHCAIPIEV